MAKPKSSQHLTVSRPGPKAGVNKALAEIKHCRYCRRMKSIVSGICKEDGKPKEGSEAETCDMFADSRRYRMTDMKGAS